MIDRMLSRLGVEVVHRQGEALFVFVPGLGWLGRSAALPPGEASLEAEREKALQDRIHACARAREAGRDEVKLECSDQVREARDETREAREEALRARSYNQRLLHEAQIFYVPMAPEEAAVDCPVCAQVAGQPCRGRDGVRSRRVHGARGVEYRLQAGPPQPEGRVQVDPGPTAAPEPTATAWSLRTADWSGRVIGGITNDGVVFAGPEPPQPEEVPDATA